MTKIVVTCRLFPGDLNYLPHFFKYYFKLGVNMFLINFNSKLHSEKELNEFIQHVISNYFEYNLIYNVGPNGGNDSEMRNIEMLKKLVKEHTNENDYIIPCDADEFHQYEFNLEECIKLIESNNHDFIKSSTNERYSSDGIIKEIKNDVDIFKQFDAHSHKLFGMPKISLIKQKYYHKLGVGHHYPNLTNSSKDSGGLNVSFIYSRTNHFRWCLDGKIRMEKWIEFWTTYPKCGGWKGVKKYTEQLKIFDDILKHV